METPQHSPEGFIPNEPLTDHQVGILVGTLGNYEPRAILFGAMRRGIMYEWGNLHTLLLDLKGEETAWNITRNKPAGYCVNVFEPNGLVETTWGKNGRRAGFTKKRESAAIADAFTGSFLDISLQHPRFSLKHTFGLTIQTAEMRLALFKRLIFVDEPLRQIDLALALGVDHDAVNKHIRSLADNGLINYETAQVTSSTMYYRRARAKPQEPLYITGTDVLLAREIYEILSHQSDSYLTQTDIAANLLHTHPGFLVDDPNLRIRITHILSDFLNGGYVEKEHFFDVVLSEEQRAYLTQIIETVNALQKMDPEALLRGEEKLRAIISDPDAVDKLMRKALQASGVPSDELLSAIVTLVSQYDGITTHMIQDELLPLTINKLSASYVNKLLRQLEKNGILESTGKKKKTWSVKTSSPPAP